MITYETISAYSMDSELLQIVDAIANHEHRDRAELLSILVREAIEHRRDAAGSCLAADAKKEEWWQPVMAADDPSIATFRPSIATFRDAIDAIDVDTKEAESDA